MSTTLSSLIQEFSHNDQKFIQCKADALAQDMISHKAATTHSQELSMPGFNVAKQIMLKADKYALAAKFGTPQLEETKRRELEEFLRKTLPQSPGEK